MSRIGKKPILIPEKAQVQIKENCVLVEGSHGKLEFNLPEGIQVEVADKKIFVKSDSSTKTIKALHGLARSMIANMIQGVAKGFQKELEINGIGFRAQVEGKKLTLVLGFTNPVELLIPEGITIETPKPTQIIVKGVDKTKVGQMAAEIRSSFPPEPYKGKGIQYMNEQVRRKAGKSVAKAA